MNNKVVIPRELKTIEVDVEKKIFRVNGEDFGRGCTKFSIQCDGPKNFHVEMRINKNVLFANYLPGEEAEVFVKEDIIGRLQEALITFVERATTKKATCEEVQVLPQIAHMLIETTTVDKF